jgi:hypothetical protein
VLTRPLPLEIFFWISLLIATGVGMAKFLPTQAVRMTAEWEEDKPILLGLLPLIGFAALLGFFAQTQAESAPLETCCAVYGLAGALLPWAVNRLNLPNEVKGWLYLAFTAFLTLYVLGNEAASGVPAVASLTAGFSVVSAVQSILNRESAQAVWQRVLPTLVWLTGLMWLKATSGRLNLTPELADGFWLVGFTVVIAVRTLQEWPQKIWENPVLKAIVLGLTSGLAVMVLTRNVLMDTEQLKFWGCLVGSVVFLMHWIEGVFGSKPDQADKSEWTGGVVSLMLLGILTLVVSRLFGTLGLCVLALCSLTLQSPRLFLLGALFWLARVGVQGFDVAHNLNVSGINLNHAYVTAALFGGFLLAWGLPVWLKNSQDKNQPLSGTQRTWLMGSLITLVATGCPYFLHAEATGSFLIALMVGALLQALLNHQQQEQQEQNQESGMLLGSGLAVALPALMTLSGGLLERGDLATRMEQGQMLAGFMIAMVLLGWVMKRLGGGPTPSTGVQSAA